MTKITVGFSYPVKFKLLAFLIKKVDGVEFSHVFIRFRSEKFDRDLIYQASNLEVNFFEGRIFDSQNHTIASFLLEMDEETYLNTLRYAIDRAGVPYGLGQLFGILFVKMLSSLGIKSKNPFGNGSRAYICSELVAEILTTFKQLELSEDLEEVTPKKLFAALTNSQHKRLK